MKYRHPSRVSITRRSDERALELGKKRADRDITPKTRADLIKGHAGHQKAQKNDRKGTISRTGKLLLLGLFCGVLGWLTFAPTHAAINKQVNFQGRLTDSAGNIVADGDYNFEFKLMTVSTGGDTTQGSCTTSCVWMETRTGASKITVTRGLLAIQLGEVASIASVNFNQDLWLSVRVGGTGTPSWDGEMTPRHRLGAAPTAIFADNAGNLNGQPDTFYRNASNINAGTLGDTYLSSNVALLNRNSQTFTGNSQLFKNASDSTTAFRIQNAAGTNLFTANTTAMQVAVGSAAVPANGALTVGTDTTAASGGIYLGTDTNLYRSAANTLKTDDSLQAANVTLPSGGTLASDGVLYLKSGATNDQTIFHNSASAERARFNSSGDFVINPANKVGWSATAGSGTIDTNLYRSAADTLKTDDSLIVSGALKANGNNVQSGGEDNLIVNGDFETNSTNGWSGITSVVTGGNAGNYTSQTTGSSNVLSDDYIPVNPVRDVFQLEGYFKKTVTGSPTPGTLYFGYIAYDANKVAVTTAPCGTYCYFAAAAVTIPADSAWHKYSATTTGEGTAFPNFPVNTKYVRVLGLINYGASSNEVTQMDHVTLKRVNHGPLFVGNNFSATNMSDQYQASQLYTDATGVLNVAPPSGVLIKNVANSTTAFQVQNAAGTSNLFVADTTNTRVAVGALPATSLLTVGTNTTTAAGGINFGTDTNLYRVGASTLKSDGAFQANSGFLVTGIPTTAYYANQASGSAVLKNFLLSSDAQPALQINGNGQMNWGAGGALATDTNLYRSAADTLKTDDSLVVASKLGVNGQTGDATYPTRLGGNTLIQGGNLYLNSSQDIRWGDSTTLIRGVGNGASGSLTATVNDNVALDINSSGNANFGGNLNTPFGGLGQFSNLLKYSEQLNNAAWANGGGVTVTANATAAPDGQTTAENLDYTTITSSNFISQTYSTGAALANRTFTFSFWAKANSTTAAAINIRTNAGTDISIYNTTLTTNWQRYTYTKTFSSGETTNQGVMVLIRSNGVTGSYYAWGTQLEEASSAGVYLATTGTVQATANFGASISGALQSNGAALFRNNADSTTAFQIQNAAGTSNLFVADTTNTRVAVGALPATSLLTVGTNTTTAAGGLTFGTDTNLYRSAADMLQTDDALRLSSGANTLTFNTPGYSPNSILAVGGSALYLQPNGGRVMISGNGFGSIAGQLNVAESGGDNPLAITNSAGTSAYLYVKNGGNVGIGTTAPSSLLQLGSDAGTAASGIKFGSTGDTNLYRSAADTLKTDDALTVAGELTLQPTSRAINSSGYIDITRATASSGALRTFVTGDTTERLQIRQDGQLLWGPGNAAADTNLYRSGANVLATDDQFLGGSVVRSNNGAGTQIELSAKSTEPAIYFGSAQDTNLYRSGANVLKTDDNFLVQTATNSTTAFQIQNAAGTSNLMVADTVNTRIGIGQATPLQALDVTGSLRLSTGNIYRPDNAGLAAQLGNGTNFYYGIHDFRDAAGGWSNLSIADAGATLFKNKTNSITAFQVQNAAGGSLVQIDSTNANITLNGLNTGELQSWNTDANSLPAARQYPASVVANGYIYAIGGWNVSNQTSVYYAKLNTDGSTGAWSTNANALPAARNRHASVVANGYVYAIGGEDGGISQSTVYYAKLNTDGSTGAWSTNANALPAGRFGLRSIVSNGYVYAIGGFNAGSQSTVYYAKLNADGSTGAWSTNANALPVGRSDHSTVMANGYVYVIGGLSGGSGQSTVYYAKLNADGSTGAWSTNANALPVTLYYQTSVVANGSVYTIGGVGAGSSVATVYYATLNADGSTGAWNTNANSMPAVRITHGTATANGYVYAIGGDTGPGPQSSVVRTSTSRIKLGGSLDLVGLGGENLSEGGTGGSLTAGNTNVIGTLQVQDQADFSQGVSIDKNLAARGTALFKNSADSTTTFQVQTAAAGKLLVVDTTNSQVEIGDATADATAVLLVLDTKNTAGDPTCVNGGVYYNSSTSQSKVCINSAWTAVGVPMVTALPSSPSDGDEIYYQADATNGIYWHFRYRSGSASAYKWEYVGGPPLYARVAAYESTTGTHTNWQDIGTNPGPQVTLPLAGDYDVDFGARTYNNAASAGPDVGIRINTVDPVTDDEMIVYSSTTAGVSPLSVKTKRFTGRAASDVLKLRYRAWSINTVCSFEHRWIRAAPVRVG